MSSLIDEGLLYWSPESIKRKDIQSIKASIFTSYSLKCIRWQGISIILREHWSKGRLFFQKRVLSKMQLYPIVLRRHKTSHDESSMGLRHFQGPEISDEPSKDFLHRDLNFPSWIAPSCLKESKWIQESRTSPLIQYSNLEVKRK
jgi:hypothetical protein